MGCSSDIGVQLRHWGAAPTFTDPRGPDRETPAKCLGNGSGTIKVVGGGGEEGLTVLYRV